jgi:hypothetical protein
MLHPKVAMLPGVSCGVSMSFATCFRSLGGLMLHLSLKVWKKWLPGLTVGTTSDLACLPAAAVDQNVSTVETQKHAKFIARIATTSGFPMLSCYRGIAVILNHGCNESSLTLSVKGNGRSHCAAFSRKAERTFLMQQILPQLEHPHQAPRIRLLLNLQHPKRLQLKVLRVLVKYCRLRFQQVCCPARSLPSQYQMEDKSN